MLLTGHTLCFQLETNSGFQGYEGYQNSRQELGEGIRIVDTRMSSRTFGKKDVLPKSRVDANFSSRPI